MRRNIVFEVPGNPFWEGVGFFCAFWFQSGVRVGFWRFENESKKNMKKRSCETRKRCGEFGGQPLRIIQFQDPGNMKGIGALQSCRKGTVADLLIQNGLGRFQWIDSLAKKITN